MNEHDCQPSKNGGVSGGSLFSDITDTHDNSPAEKSWHLLTLGAEPNQMTLPFQGAEQPWLERVNLWPAGNVGVWKNWFASKWYFEHDLNRNKYPSTFNIDKPESTAINHSILGIPGTSFSNTPMCCCHGRSLLARSLSSTPSPSRPSSRSRWWGW